MSRRPRHLSREERQLWAHVARAVRPMPGRPALEPESAGTVGLQPDSAPVPTLPVRAKSPQPGPPPLVPLERRVLRALGRGTQRFEAVIDLHGLRQAEAHLALASFLRRAQGQGQKIVLVVTGKGSAEPGEHLYDGRGVLRRLVPHWLRLPEMRTLVLGFEEAAAHHGGSGALYIRLRRRHPAG